MFKLNSCFFQAISLKPEIQYLVERQVIWMAHGDLGAAKRGRGGRTVVVHVPSHSNVPTTSAHFRRKRRRLRG